jgi:Ca-activated chloride channel family protein
MQRDSKRLMKYAGAMVVASAFLGGSAGAEEASRVKLDVSLASPILAADKKQSAYLKVGLTGFEREASKRAPINLSIVLDRSGSMAEDHKMEKAKEAAVMILDRLGSEDVVSVVAFDWTVEVLVPATKLTDKAKIQSRIMALYPRGSTALFAGVSKGIEEVRKFKEGERVNRVVLLSDGQANVGPGSPNELGRLGASCAKEGISITTIGLGLGYNEDLMTQLAVKSDGNHAFAQNASELTKIFNLELGEVLSVIAQEVSIKVKFADGVRPVRVLNREGEVQGQSVILALNQLYSKQEKFFLIEAEVGPKPAGSKMSVAGVDVSYANLVTHKTDRLSAAAEASFSASLAEVEAKTNREVMVAVVENIANDNNRRAVLLRDEGKVDEAEKALNVNSGYLRESARKLGPAGGKLLGTAAANDDDAKNLRGGDWLLRRKVMRKKQHTIDTQQSY